MQVLTMLIGALVLISLVWIGINTVVKFINDKESKE